MLAYCLQGLLLTHPNACLIINDAAGESVKGDTPHGPPPHASYIMSHQFTANLFFYPSDSFLFLLGVLGVLAVHY
jgi:hypothetical protein